MPRKLKIKIKMTKKPKPKPDQNNLGFGRFFTDHMFIMDYLGEKGWRKPRIVPYEPIKLDPGASVLHYGQETFEGLKAYRSGDGRILIFRPRKNIERLNRSNERMCIPEIDPDFELEALKALIKLEKDWIPTAPGTALYIRPFVIAAEPFLGVRAAKTYYFIIILSPVGSYYPQGINPIRIYVESKYVRAVKGGTGYAKAGGNYAAGLKAQQEAAQKGYVQVLWLDGIEHKYIEEVGAMNVFFKIKGKVVTPPLEGTILPGVTRDSIIQILKQEEIDIAERRISIQELSEAYEKGELEEAFGTGTAAVISPIGELNWQDRNMVINNNKIGPLSQKLYDTITGIQTGRIKDPYGWIVEVT
ncbi:MAG TPA: branched-chain amino acid aminotransferase [bacterium]